MICCNGKNIKTVSVESEFDMPALRLGEKSKGVNLILISLAFALAFLVKMPITEYLNCGLTGCQVQKNLKSPKLAKWQIQKRPYQYPKIFKRYDIALFDLVKISIFSGGNQHSLSLIAVREHLILYGVIWWLENKLFWWFYMAFRLKMLYVKSIHYSNNMWHFLAYFMSIWVKELSVVYLTRCYSFNRFVLSY